MVDAVEVETALRGVQLEAAVERREQPGAPAGRDVVVHTPVPRPRVLRAGAERELHQPLVNRRDPVDIGGVLPGIAQQRAEDRRVAPHLLHHAPLTLAGQRRAASQRLQRGRDVWPETVLLGLERGRGLTLRDCKREGRLAAGLGRVVGKPFAERDDRAEVVVACPFGQVGGDTLAIVLEGRLAGREHHPDEEDADERADHPDGRAAGEPAQAAEPNRGLRPAPTRPVPTRPVPTRPAGAITGATARAAGGARATGTIAGITASGARIAASWVRVASRIALSLVALTVVALAVVTLAVVARIGVALAVVALTVVTLAVVALAVVALAVVA